jgi:DNA-binding Lrp family transcriptional regulator
MEDGPLVLDDLDRKIVARLRVDGRETNRSLAVTLGVNEATVAARLRRMEANNVIHVVALTDMHRLGFEYFALAFIAVTDRPVLDVARDISRIPQVISVNVNTGRYDLVCALLAQDRAELGAVIGEAMPRVVGIGAVRCELAVDVLRFDSAWAALSAAEGPHDLPQPSVPTGAVDDLDLRIIDALQHDARSSNRRIASELDVSEGTVRTRLRRMEDEQLLRIQAVSDVAAFGLQASATVGVHVAAGQIKEVELALTHVSGLGAIIRSIGEFDFVLIALAQTRAGLFDIILQQIQTIPGIHATETFENVATLKHVYTWVRLVGDSAAAARSTVGLVQAPTSGRVA